MKALILAGGKGTRMGHLVATIPKPLIHIGGKPIIEHQIELLQREGFHDIVILINHLGNVIRDYCGDGSKWGVHISYFEEKHPLGTAGAIRLLADSL
ncbi:MAG: nucleotidyltransferase family protein, partial [candidate division Zixibacteria bacterium]|nr:nucleotidyltransferase family protein [candidate division Zixibacteria bacterium]